MPIVAVPSRCVRDAERSSRRLRRLVHGVRPQTTGWRVAAKGVRRAAARHISDCLTRRGTRKYRRRAGYVRVDHGVREYNADAPQEGVEGVR